MALFYTQSYRTYSHNRQGQVPTRTTLSDIKVAFRLLERLLSCSAVYTDGDKHEDKLFVYCVTLFVNGRVFRGALVCT